MSTPPKLHTVRFEPVPKLAIMGFHISFFPEDTYIDIVAFVRVWLGAYAIIDQPATIDLECKEQDVRFIKLPDLFLYPGRTLRLYAYGDCSTNISKFADSGVIRMNLGLTDFCWNTKSESRARLIRYKTIGVGNF